MYEEMVEPCGGSRGAVMVTDERRMKEK